MNYRKIYKRKRGQLLLVALSILFILTILASAIVYQGRNSLFFVLRAQKQNMEEQCIQKVRVNTLEKLSTMKPAPTPYPSPSPSPFTVAPDNIDFFKMKGNLVNRRVQKGAGFNPNEIPSAGYQDSIDLGSFGMTDVKLPPWHSFVSFSSPQKEKYNMMFSAAFPYAAYAPRGNVKLDSAKGYTNPKITYMASHKWDENKQYSGVPVKIAAERDIDVDDFPYGEAYTAEGKVAINKQNGGIGYRRKIYTDGDKNYADIYRKQALDAFDDEISGQTLDKSEFLFLKGSIIDLDTFFDIIIGKTDPSVLKHIFSLQQAMSFPFFSYISVKDYGVDFEVYFHIPAPPDNSKIDKKQIAANKRDKDIIKQIKQTWDDVDMSKIQDRYENQDFYNKQQQLKKMFDQKIQGKKWDDQTDLEKMKEIKLYIEKSFHWDETNKKYYIEKQDSDPFPPHYDLVTLKKKETDYAKWLQDYWKNKKQHIHSGEITFDLDKASIADEKELLEEKNGSTSDKYGVEGYNYCLMLKKALSFFWDLIRFQVHKAMKEFEYNIRVVHYRGGKPDFSVGDGSYGLRKVKFKSDLTVPRGRTLKLNCNLEIEGDVWLQDGATLFITGDLDVKNPGKDSSDGESNGEKFKDDILKGIEAVFKPRGRVFLGRGSNLLVGGSFSCEGSPHTGSIIVDSELGDVKYITSSIICKGNVNIPHGVLPGLSLSSLGNLLKRNGYDLIGTFLKDIVFIPSQVAKLIGPFHRRYCCFARWPDPWSILNIDIFGVDIIIPFPDPLDYSSKNINVGVFRIVSTTYTILLNVTLGEHMFTDSSWWVLGTGSVPILPKVAGIQGIADFFKDIDDFKQFSDDFKDDLKKLLEDIDYESLVKDAMIKVLIDVGEHVIGSITDIPSDIIDKAVKKLFGSLIDDLYDKYNTKNPEEYVKKLKEKFENYLKEKLYEELKFLFYETSGVLIYSDNSLTIGKENQETGSCVYAAGLFVAKNDVKIYADKTVGAVMSVEGDIVAKDLLYYPFFTRASLNVPVKKSLWKEAIDPRIFESTKQPVEIGKEFYHVISEGWVK